MKICFPTNFCKGSKSVFVLTIDTLFVSNFDAPCASIGPKNFQFFCLNSASLLTLTCIVFRTTFLTVFIILSFICFCSLIIIIPSSPTSSTLFGKCSLSISTQFEFALKERILFYISVLIEMKEIRKNYLQRIPFTRYLLFLQTLHILKINIIKYCSWL